MAYTPTLYDCGFQNNDNIIYFTEVVEETKGFVQALQSNHPLQSEFISLLSHPGRNLLRLSDEVYMKYIL